MAYQTQNLKQKKASSIKQKYSAQEPEIRLLHILPIIFALAILPLIVKLREYSANLSQFDWFTKYDTYYDFFLYYKQVFLIATAVIMVAIILYYAYKDKKSIRFSTIFIPLGIYAALALLSSLTSNYRSYSFTGISDQFESIFALLAYCCLAYYAFLYVKSEKALIFVVYSLLISALVISLLGLTQVTGHDFYNTQAGWNLISNSIYRNYKEEFNFVAGINRVYLSFYNPNYVGVYVTMVLPIMLFMTIFTKKLWLRLIFLVAMIGLSICLYGSKSTAGFVGVTVAIVFSIILLWRYIIKYFYIAIPIVIIAIITLFVVNSKYDNYIINQVKKITDIQKSTPSLSEIQTNDENIVIKYNGNTLKVVFLYDPSGICYFVLKDENDADVPSTLDATTGAFTITDDRFKGFVLTPAMNGDNLGFTVLIDNTNWFFTNQTEDYTYYYMNMYGKLTKMMTAPSALFTEYEQYASGRGYIWSRTIPLLKNKIILGSGADTFTFEFPQQDYVNKYNFGFGTQLMTKPHNLYLQMAVQTGILSVIAFLVFYVMYFISSIKLYIKGRFDQIYSIIGAAIFTSTLGYMICGLTNDSSITIAPVYWTLIGIGIAINIKVKQQMTLDSNKQEPKI